MYKWIVSECTIQSDKNTLAMYIECMGVGIECMCVDIECMGVDIECMDVDIECMGVDIAVSVEFMERTQ